MFRTTTVTTHLVGRPPGLNSSLHCNLIMRFSFFATVGPVIRPINVEEWNGDVAAISKPEQHIASRIFIMEKVLRDKASELL